MSGGPVRVVGSGTARHSRCGVLASLVQKVPVSLTRTDSHADPSARGGVLEPVGSDLDAVLDAAGGEIVGEPGGRAGRVALSVVVDVCKFSRRAQTHAGEVVPLPEKGPLRGTLGNAGLSAVVGVVPSRAVKNTFPYQRVGVKVRFGCAGRLAPVRGVVGKKTERSATGLAGAVTCPCVGTGRAGSDAVPVGIVGKFIRVGGTGPDAHLRVPVSVFGQSSVAG